MSTNSLFTGKILKVLTASTAVLLAGCYTSMNKDLPEFPLQCTPFQAQEGQPDFMLRSPKGKQSVYVIRNKTKGGVWIDHQIAEPAASAGWSSYMDKMRFTSLSLNRPYFRLTCYGDVLNEDRKPVPCAQVVDVCKADNARFALGTQGTYWAGENMKSVYVVERLSHRGIYVLPAKHPEYNPDLIPEA